MIRPIRFAVAALLLALTMLVPLSSHAAEPYQGTYVIIDPYNASQVALLQTASQTACVKNLRTATTPFCGATNGILLRIGWCSFQLYHETNQQGVPYPSCHYVVGYAHGVGSAGKQIPQSDTVSPCPYTYDVCSGSTSSVLGTALGLIATIDTLRANASLPPLKLSVGMSAGIWTPQSILDSGGYVDVPHQSGNGSSAKTRCYRLPLIWPDSYANSYDRALDQLLSFIAGQFPAGANIAILKASGITATDLEIEMPGRAQTLAAPVDPGPGSPGPKLNCTSEPGAQSWLDAYNAAPVGNKTFSQAVETAFGGIIGHEYGALLNLDLPNTLLSIPTTGGSGLSDVDCGTTGADTCKVESGTGNWPLYYLDRYTDDLFDGGLAQSAAAAAYGAIRSDAYDLQPAQLAVNWTGLSPQPINPEQQVGCILNNTSAALDPTLKLDGTRVPLPGAGTTLGWQTQTGSGAQCKTGVYQTTLANGILNGGQFLEIETDAAFTHIAECSPYLVTALAQIIAIIPPTQCVY